VNGAAPSYSLAVAADGFHSSRSTYTPDSTKDQNAITVTLQPPTTTLDVNVEDTKGKGQNGADVVLTVKGTATAFRLTTSKVGLRDGVARFKNIPITSDYLITVTKSGFEQGSAKYNPDPFSFSESVTVTLQTKSGKVLPGR